MYITFSQIGLRESASFNDLALCIIGTRIAITSVNDRIAILAIKSRYALTFVVTVRQGSASGFIFARIILAQITFAQDTPINVFHTFK